MMTEVQTVAQGTGKVVKVLSTLLKSKSASRAQKKVDSHVQSVGGPVLSSAGHSSETMTSAALSSSHTQQAVRAGKSKSVTVPSDSSRVEKKCEHLAKTGRSNSVMLTSHHSKKNLTSQYRSEKDLKHLARTDDKSKSGVTHKSPSLENNLEHPTKSNSGPSYDLQETPPFENGIGPCQLPRERICYENGIESHMLLEGENGTRTHQVIDTQKHNSSSNNVHNDSIDDLV